MAKHHLLVVVYILFVLGEAFCPPVCVFFFGSAIMVVPFSNRAAVVRLPELALAKGPTTVKEVIDDFASQCEPFSSILECVQLVRGRTLRITFPTADVREDVTNGGLTFRGHPLAFTIPTTFKWVSVLDLPYGTPDGDIANVLNKHGQVATIRSEVYKGLYTGTRLVKMTVKSAIPSRVTIAGHVCTIFYRGQIRSCFRCGASGHEAKKCPRKNATLSAAIQPADTHLVGPPMAPNVDAMSTEPPTSPRTFAGVVSGQTPPVVTDVPLPRSLSPVTLPLPTSPIRGLGQDSPGMDIEVQSQKRPYSPVSESEGTDTDASERTRPRLEEPPPTEPTIVEPVIRDRSPLRSAATGNDSTSDSSGKSPTSKASVIVLPAAQLAFPEELLLKPPPSFDRRPLSTRYREYCFASPEYSEGETEELVGSMLEVERRLASPTIYGNQEDIELQQTYDHLTLDQIIAFTACANLDDNDPQLVIPGQALKDADEALANFEAAFPEVVQAAEEQSVEVRHTIEPPSTQVINNTSSPAIETPLANPSVSLEIPDGQPQRPRTENPSPVDISSPLLFPEGEATDSAASTTKSGSLKTRRRSRHKSKSPTGLASCVRQRTTPALPGVRKKTSRAQHQPPPDSPYTPLVTESGYLVTDPPSGTSTNKPKRPDTGVAGAISPTPSSDVHP